MQRTVSSAPSLCSAWRFSPKRHLISRRSRAPLVLQCSSSSFSDSVSRKAKEAQKKFEKWAEQERVKERLDQASRTASSKAQQAFESVQDGMQRTAAQLDREYDVQSKAQRVAGKVREVADDVESRFGVWRKTQNLYQDVKRKWPTWRRQLGEFFETSTGKVVGVLLVTTALYTGVLFRLINLFFLILVFSPLFVGPYLRQKVMEQERAQQEAYARAQQDAQQAQQQQFMNDLFGRFRGGQQQRQRQAGQQSGFGGGASRKPKSDAGSVIDVDWKTVDED